MCLVQLGALFPEAFYLFMAKMLWRVSLQIAVFWWRATLLMPLELCHWERTESNLNYCYFWENQNYYQPTNLREKPGSLNVSGPLCLNSETGERLSLTKGLRVWRRASTGPQLRSLTAGAAAAVPRAAWLQRRRGRRLGGTETAPGGTCEGSGC